MSIPEFKDFERWVAAPNEGLTSIVNPVIFGHDQGDIQAIEQARTELSIYHPSDPNTENYGLRHTAVDSGGGGHAFAANFRGNWHADMKRAYRLLQLRIGDENSNEILLDDRQENGMPVMEGWKIKRWTMAKEFTGPPDHTGRPTLILKDKITWLKGGIEVFSEVGWRPYIKNH